MNGRSPVEQPATLRTGGSDGAESMLLKLRLLLLLLLGQEVKVFNTQADPSEPKQLRRLLTAAARRHAGGDVELSDYELEVLHAKTGELITTYVSP